MSGSINMNLSACVENDVAFAPFHDQYMRLHEVNRKSRIDFNVFKFFLCSKCLFTCILHSHFLCFLSHQRYINPMIMHLMNVNIVHIQYRF